jgi:hypothetical protein
MKQIQTLIKTYHEADMGGHDINILHMSEIHDNFAQPELNKFTYNSNSDSDQSDWYTQQNFNYNNPLKEEHRLRKFRIFHSYMKRYNCNTVLDVGFGSGYYSWNSAVNGYKVTAADFENGAYHMMKSMIDTSDIKNLELYSLNKHSIGEITKKYDAVLSIEVLEHILDPLPLHESQIKLCDKVFFLEEYCGDRTVTGHIAPYQAKKQIIDMCLDYNFVELPITYGYPPQIFVKRDLL